LGPELHDMTIINITPANIQLFMSSPKLFKFRGLQK